ncbi:MAG: HAMP domain-containing histidine kinase [Pirellulaceae bacterium]|nr:HAMP domain-containing histidine kinase [Pirellulaceae bacterium]
MKRPWHIWTIYIACILLGLPAMGWFTHKSLDVDRAESLARAKIEHEGIVQAALWRMDAELLTPLVAQETTRPLVAYQTVEQSLQAPSARCEPLVLQPEPYVKLNFQYNADGTVQSPQAASDDTASWAVKQGTTYENIQLSKRRLSQLEQTTNRNRLLKMLPADALPHPSPAPNSNASVFSYNNEAVISHLQGLGSSNISDHDHSPSAFGLDELTDTRLAEETTEFQQSAIQTQRQVVSNSRKAVRDLRRRNEFVQSTTRQSSPTQRSEPVRVSTLSEEHVAPIEVIEGITNPLWIGGELLLARRVHLNQSVIIQGAWLDWTKLKSDLLSMIAEELPHADLVPLRPDDIPNASRALAALPAELIVPQPNIPPAHWLSPMRLSIGIAWTGLLASLVAVAILLAGVISLSERRADFVSAVTHELRTPLTTFRMYAEMLAEDMVRDPQQKKDYAQTLHREASRLSHLVDNVLSYSRLERGTTPKTGETITVHQLLEPTLQVLKDRLEQAGMTIELHAERDTTDITLTTDPSAVEQILFNLIDNACKYAASTDDPRVLLNVHSTPQHIELSVTDHGPGIDASLSKRLFQPFSKSAEEAAHSCPGVGLGLALSHRLARQLGGKLTWVPTRPGATFRLSLPRT